MQATKEVRWYVRCRDCVEPFVVVLPRGEQPWRLAEATCACGGKLEVMGSVRDMRGGTWERTEHISVCDDRCTCAVGPKCECPCGGANHGTGRTVEVVREVGAVRLATCPEAARVRGAEYRAALEAARARITARYGDVRARKAAGEYLDGDTYWGFRHAGEALTKAARLRTHKGRLKALAAVGLTTQGP